MHRARSTYSRVVCIIYIYIYIYLICIIPMRCLLRKASHFVQTNGLAGRRTVIILDFSHTDDVSDLRLYSAFTNEDDLLSLAYF